MSAPTPFPPEPEERRPGAWVAVVFFLLAGCGIAAYLLWPKP